MPVKRTEASGEQRALFGRLSNVPFVVGAKPAKDLWSVNLHGRCILFDKDWSNQTNESPRETLLAVVDGETVPLTPSGEPRFHLHVDWSEVRWAKLVTQNLDLIGTDRAVAFHARQDSGRLFALYCLDKDIGRLMVLDEWIDLKPLATAPAVTAQPAVAAAGVSPRR